MLGACREVQKTKAYWKYYPEGYYARLWYFDSVDSPAEGSKMLVSAVFATQNDSVFWDSRDHLGGCYIVETDTNAGENLLQYHVARSSPGDSVTMLVPVHRFFSDFFNCSRLPYFSESDTVVKIGFKVIRQLSGSDERAIIREGQKRERRAIRSFFRSEEAYEHARDENGIFWLSEKNPGTAYEGARLRLFYRTYFLSGRPLENCEQVFDFEYGVPDQLIPGLNIVIPFLKLGENAKIILPSCLAFGDSGSSNGIVPPFTPLIFEIKLLSQQAENN